MKETFIENWVLIILLVELGMIAIVIVYYASRDIINAHRVKYQNNKLKSELAKRDETIIDLNNKIYGGNLKYLQDKKRWLESTYEILLTHKASVFQIRQDINKIEKQILKLKSE